MIKNILYNYIHTTHIRSLMRVHHSGFTPIGIWKHFKIHLRLWRKGYCKFPKRRHIKIEQKLGVQK